MVIPCIVSIHIRPGVQQHPEHLRLLGLNRNMQRLWPPAPERMRPRHIDKSRRPNQRLPHLFPPPGPDEPQKHPCRLIQFLRHRGPRIAEPGDIVSSGMTLAVAPCFPMPSRKRFLTTLAAAVLPRRAAAANYSAAVVVYGATPAGLAAARAAARAGQTVVLIEPSRHIGGLVTGGISCTDTGTPQWVGGVSAEFYEAVAAETRRRYPNPKTPELLFRGQKLPWRPHKMWDFEPQVAFQVYESWVRQSGIRLIRSQRVASARHKDGVISEIRLTNGDVIQGKVFVDASYEGDLMARANVPHTWGRESIVEHNEDLNGVRTPHFRKFYTEEYLGKPGIEYTHHGQFSAEVPARGLWGVAAKPEAAPGSADKKIQAYCFRLIATQRPDIRVPWPKPKNYLPQRYELLLKYVLAHPAISFARLVHFSAIPNGKFDLNASGPFSIDYVGGNYAYPGADYPERDKIFADHMDYQQGFLWFLAHDPRVPATLRDEVNTWGLCRDEYPDTNHWPVQLYIRECRRLQGEYLMTQHDILTKKTKDDSVGMGSFVLDSHWVERYADDAGHARIEGHLDETISLAKAPYEIPFRCLLPRRESARNLIVPVCVSATHVAICTIRMEPVYMMLGHAAGLAAARAAASGAAVQDLDSAALITALRAEGAVLHASQARNTKIEDVI